MIRWPARAGHVARVKQWYTARVPEHAVDQVRIECGVGFAGLPDRIDVVLVATSPL